MKRTALKKIPVQCPSCGYEQMEYAEATASACHSCGTYIPIKNNSQKKNRRTDRKVRIRHIRVPRHEITCMSCKFEQSVPSDSVSWQCTNCGSYLDMTTHEISGRYPSKILTYNGVVIESQGHFSGPRADAEWIRVAGFSSGVLNAWKDLEVDGHAQLKNRASAKHLTVHPDCILEAEQLLEFETAEIRGLVRARKMIVAQSCIITSTAEVHVDQLYFGSLQLEEGGILHGRGMSINLAKNLPVS